MKSGHLVGGIAIGALVGIGVGFVLGVDAEKRKQWMKFLTAKVLGGKCDCDDSCDCGPEELEAAAAKKP